MKRLCLFVLLSILLIGAIILFQSLNDKWQPEQLAFHHSSISTSDECFLDRMIQDIEQSFAISFEGMDQMTIPALEKGEKEQTLFPTTYIDLENERGYMVAKLEDGTNFLLQLERKGESWEVIHQEMTKGVPIIQDAD